MIRVIPLTIISLFFVLLFSSQVLASQQNNLAEVRVLVKDESSKERSTGIYNGLARVLIRISGKNDILSSPAAENILKQSSKYMLQYSYENLSVEHKNAFFEENYEVANFDSANQNALKNAPNVKILKLRFDQPLIVKRLQEQGFPVWIDQRPELLLWWVREDQGSRKVISDSDNQLFTSEMKIKSAFYFASEQKGLLVKLPLMDIQDQQSISVSELWGGFEEQLAAASERYQVSSYVNGKSYYQNGNWHASWRLYLFGEKIDFEDSNASVYTLHQNVVNSIAEYLAKEYALSGRYPESQLLINISGIKDEKTFAAVESYFERLVVVESFSLVKVNGEQLTYLITIKEDLKKLERIFSFEKKIVAVTQQALLGSREVEIPARQADGNALPKSTINTTVTPEWFYRWENTR